MSLRVIDGGAPPDLGTAEYVWVKGSDFRSKTRVIPVFHGPDGPEPKIEPWTTAAPPTRIVLSPCYFIPNPFLPQPAYLVLCEVCDEEGKPSPFNSRARLRALLHKEGGRCLAEWGFMQQYDSPMSVQAWKAAQDHLLRCIDADLRIHSACIEDNSSVWNFKIGRRPDIDGALGQNYTIEMCDHLLLARFLLERAAREHDAILEFTEVGSAYFSTVEMREDETFLEAAAARLEEAAESRDVRQSIRTRDGYVEATGLRPLFDPYDAAAFLLGTLLKE
jgi:hypothetical protein